MAVIKVMKHSNGPIMADTSEKEAVPARDTEWIVLQPFLLSWREHRLFRLKVQQSASFHWMKAGATKSFSVSSSMLLLAFANCSPTMAVVATKTTSSLTKNASTNVKWSLRMFRVLPTFADPCRDPLGPERCKEGVENRYYYDVDAGHCKETGFGFCSGHWDSFIGLEECKTRCEDVCTRPMDPGVCHSKQRRFYYNREENRCLPFIYTGCRGNGNRFHTQAMCHKMCRRGCD
ncbi:tissue factor pathway inhibitor-like [Rhipicephalus microplus]|uniref:tissue factor pathway inhibitor-like n=1 Tax=Rhipicephalus microplus TaxID=6941 RepID=UPI003F6C7217